MTREIVLIETNESSEIVELTAQEVEVVSGGCGPRCCVDQACHCGGW